METNYVFLIYFYCALTTLLFVLLIIINTYFILNTCTNNLMKYL